MVSVSPAYDTSLLRLKWTIDSFRLQDVEMETFHIDDGS